MSRALGAALLLAATPALAWESVCNQYANPAANVADLGAPTPCAPSFGPNAARQRWVGNLDEHRALFVAALREAGLPAAYEQTKVLTVFTGAADVTIGGAAAPSLMPVRPALAERVQTRAFSVPELAQLPDFSYGLWDWAQGHETCPPGLGTTSADFCHDFAAHMGPVNANHFVPMAQTFYLASHELALARARACASLQLALGADAARFAPVVVACADEALALEAVAQHYLQDAWSMGHMWQRWGSADLSDFPGAAADERRETAVLVALVSGLIHGSRGVLQKLPQWTTYDVNDALCAPSPTVRYANDQGLTGAVGDDYLASLPPYGGGATFEVQWSRLQACAVTGVLEVYRAAGEPLGAAAPATAPLSAAALRGADCFGQRATNASMLKAMALDLKTGLGQITLTLDSRVVGALVPIVATEQGEVQVSETTRARFRLGLQRQVSLTRLRARRDPDGTQIADGVSGAFMGVPANGLFATRARPAEYFDPPLPWPGAASGVDAERAAALALVFREAHAADWCPGDDAAALSALKARAQDGNLSIAAHGAACDACTEVVKHHLRVGSPGNYDVAREPLCRVLSSAAAVVYQAGSTSDAVPALARAHCGCP